jgi:hypothetical protein
VSQGKQGLLARQFRRDATRRLFRPHSVISASRRPNRKALVYLQKVAARASGAGPERVMPGMSRWPFFAKRWKNGGGPTICDVDYVSHCQNRG